MSWRKSPPPPPYSSGMLAHSRPAAPALFHSSRSPCFWARQRASFGTISFSAKRAAVSGSGIFKDQASDATVRTAFFDGAILDWQVLIPDFGTVTGRMQVTALEYFGQYNGEVMFDLALESAGQLTFGAV